MVKDITFEQGFCNKFVETAFTLSLAFAAAKVQKLYDINKLYAIGYKTPLNLLYYMRKGITLGVLTFCNLFLLLLLKI